MRCRPDGTKAPFWLHPLQTLHKSARKPATMQSIANLAASASHEHHMPAVIRETSLPREEAKLHNGHDGLISELKAARSFVSVIVVLWRYLALNVLVEHIEVFDEEEGDITSLTSMYNLIALISALLLSCGIGPLTGMATVIDAYGENMVTRFANVCLIWDMGACLLNLCVIVLLTFYITAVDRTLRHQELIDFPFFGFPLVLVILSVFLSILWVLSTIYMTMPIGYIYFSTIFLGTVSLIGIPLVMYAFFFRLSERRHDRVKAKEKKNKLPDISAEEFEKMLVRVLAKQREGAEVEKK